MDLYELLKSGETDTKIISDFTAQLNAAKKKIEQEKKEEAKRAAEEKLKNKNLEIARENLKKALTEYFYTRFAKDGITTEDISISINEAINNIERYCEIADSFFDLFKKPPTTIAFKNDETIIKNFINSLLDGEM